MKWLLRLVAVIVVLAILTSAGFRTTDCSRSNGVRASLHTLSTMLNRNHNDTGSYPGTVRADQENDIPEVFAAIYSDRIAAGREPYMEFKLKDLAVRDGALDEYRAAEWDEIDDPRTPKFLLDPWGHPYIYRREPSGFVLYSLGPDGIDQTKRGERGDDLVVRRPLR